MEIAAVNLMRPDWLQDFFPPDLPGQWRLGYYANEFRALMLPSSFWSGGKGCAVLREWQDGLPRYFRLYACLDDALLVDPLWPEVMKLLGSLGGGPAGLVLHLEGEGLRNAERTLRARFPAAVLCVDGQPVHGLPRLWRPGITSSTGSLGIAVFDAPPDPLSLRTVIEDFAGCASGPEPVLFLDAPPDTVEKAQLIVDLLGA